MIRVAFASKNQTQVNLHFGAAEFFIVYDISPGEAELVGIAEFIQAEMRGFNKDVALPIDYVPTPKERQEAASKSKEDKVNEKMEFLKDCVAVYAASIGESSIKRLMTANIQPIIVENGRDIVELLNEISIAMSVRGKLSWVDRALAKHKVADRFDSMENECLINAVVPHFTSEAQRNELIASVIEEIRPNIIQDGGDLELIAVEGEKVFVRLSGKCTTCSMAGQTLGGVRRQLMGVLGVPVRVIPVSVGN